MYYQISTVTEDGWIVIDSSVDGEKGIGYLIQAYQEKIGGQIIKPYEDDMQYMIKGDPYKLVFQYDSMFGSVVILNDLADRDKVVEILQGIFLELKSKN